MFEIKTTQVYRDWFFNISDSITRKRINVRITRIQTGNFGDHKSVGDGVYELRMTFGPGYRVYYRQDGNTIIILLCGGDKSTQTKDIKLAKEIAKEV